MNLALHRVPVLVTGGSRGVGRAIAIAFAQEGATVAICGRDRLAMGVTAKAVEEAGGTCVVIEADLAIPGECERVVKAAASAMGGLAVLINNASMSVEEHPNTIDGASEAQIFARIGGKTWPAVSCAKAAVNFMRDYGYGRVINIGGTSSRDVFREGELPSPGLTMPQGIGNAALATFTKYLSEELVSQNITVNIVLPHTIKTDRHAQRVAYKASELGLSDEDAEKHIASLIPMGRLIGPEDISPLVTFLASSLASAVTGQAIAVDGGASRSICY